MYPMNPRAVCAGLLTVALFTAGCGSDDQSSAPEGDGSAVTTKAKPSPVAMQAKKAEVATCLTKTGHQLASIDAAAMKVPQDIQAVVRESGAGVLHLPKKKGANVDESHPAVDILIEAGKHLEPAFGSRVSEWLDERAGLIDTTRPEGLAPDLSPPTGPVGFSEGPDLGGVFVIGYGAAPKPFHNALVGCHVIRDDGTTYDQESSNR